MTGVWFCGILWRSGRPLSMSMWAGDRWKAPCALFMSWPRPRRWRVNASIRLIRSCLRSVWHCCSSRARPKCSSWMRGVRTVSRVSSFSSFSSQFIYLFIYGTVALFFFFNKKWTVWKMVNYFFIVFLSLWVSYTLFDYLFIFLIIRT